jgi:L-fuculose-phosphate aldolase
MKELGKTPSRAVHMHALIYKHNPEIRAILQAHPLNAMAFAVTGAKFDPRTIPESYILLRDIQMLPYAELFGDQESLAKKFGPAHPAMLVEDNCAIVTGNSLLQAFDRLEVLESTAHSIINSLTLGPVVHISDDEVNDLKKAFHLED